MLESTLETISGYSSVPICPFLLSLAPVTRKEGSILPLKMCNRSNKQTCWTWTRLRVVKGQR